MTTYELAQLALFAAFVVTSVRVSIVNRRVSRLERAVAEHDVELQLMRHLDV